MNSELGRRGNKEGNVALKSNETIANLFSDQFFKD